MNAGAAAINVAGFELQKEPKVYVGKIPGHWLLERTTPSWRIKDPEKGFQRVVREERARQIALAVLDQQRTFPNAIVLATDKTEFTVTPEGFNIPTDVWFLVVDGQHRLWAQKFSEHNAQYACVIHMGLSEVAMARLFLEINDNQKRVPSSLRWDLLRLVRPEDDPYGIAAAELVYELATEKNSPLYQRVDLTGEQNEIHLKLASLAPEVRPLLTKSSPLHEMSFEQQLQVLVQYLIAIQQLDADGWGHPESAFYKARVLRGLFRLLPQILTASGKDAADVRFEILLSYLKKIDPATLDAEKIRAAQGSAGIKAIFDEMHSQVFG